jgi:hypothetical protein
MAPRRKSQFWRLCRIYFRRFRITVWFIILVVLGSLLYVNQVGLPGFVKKPLLDRLRVRGLDLQFSRLRLRWYQGIVAENVRFGQPDEPLSPSLTLAELQVRLNYRALSRFQVQVDSVMLRKGRLVLPLAQTNQPSRELTVENIQSELHFLPDDQWMLENFKAQIAGATIRLGGIVTNASSVRDWKLFGEGPAVSLAAGVWRNRLRRFADTLEQIHFSAPPDLRLDVRGDARALQSFSVLILVAAPGAETPWGAVSHGRLNGRLFPADTNGIYRADLTLQAVDAQTPWAAITNFQLGIHLSSLAGLTNPVNGDMTLSSAQVQTKWASGTNALFTAQWVHAMTNPIPISGHGRLHCAFAQTKWAIGTGIDVSLALATPVPADLPPRDPSWAWWTNLQPFSLDWDCRVRELQSPKLLASSLSCGGTWRAPRLTMTNFQARLYGGQLQLRGGLDVATRIVNASVASDCEPHRISQLLSEDSRHWLEQFTWDTPPRLKADVSFVLPPWTNQSPNWQAELQSGLSLQGEVNFDRGGVYHQVQVTSARSHFSYSKQCLHLPDLTLTRPEGGVAAVHDADGRTGDFYWRVSSTIDPRCLRPLLDKSQLAVFDLFSLTQPPALQAEVWGRYGDPQRLGFKGQVALTNVTFRGEAITGVQTSVQYTNGFLQFFEPRVQYGTQHASASGVAADFNKQFVYLTNGFSTAEPMFIARVIGPQIAAAIDPYRFIQPPTAHVYGTIPMHGEAGADLHFDLDGGPFHWWKFHVPRISGHVHWAGERLSLTNVQTDFYQGIAVGSARFDFTAKQGADFQFALATTNTLLQALMSDLSTQTNRLEGRLSGSLVVSSANTENWQTVDGYGDMGLRDGLIWDIPVFGIFSPVLNGLVPGLGNSRASAAACSFVITNGVIFSDDLDIRSTGMRMQYRGTVDLEGRLHAKVEASLLRDMWLVGPLVSTIFWPVTKMFEYKVTGTLDEPKTDPVFIIPKIVLLPFHTFRASKNPPPEQSSPASTNAPPASK